MTTYWFCDTCGRLPDRIEILEDPLYGTFIHECVEGLIAPLVTHPVRLVREP